MALRPRHHFYKDDAELAVSVSGAAFYLIKTCRKWCFCQRMWELCCSAEVWTQEGCVQGRGQRLFSYKGTCLHLGLTPERQFC